MYTKKLLSRDKCILNLYIYICNFIYIFDNYLVIFKNYLVIFLINMMHTVTYTMYFYKYQYLKSLLASLHISCRVIISHNKYLMTQMGALVKEKVKHMEEKPFKYTRYICAVACRNGASNYNYWIPHTGDKPLYCYNCRVHISISNILVKHKIRHIGENPHCPKICYCTLICKYNRSIDEHIYFNRLSLNYYMDVIYLMRPFSCTECGKCKQNPLFHMSIPIECRSHVRNVVNRKRNLIIYIVKEIK